MRLHIITTLVALTASTTLASAVDRVILYADSLSDNGNVYKHSGFPPSPPYWQGRFSNGPTWAEHVAKTISIPFSNYGYAGAPTNNDDVYSMYNGYVVPGFKQQVETIKTKATSKSLFIIEFGYNDLNAILYPGFYNVINTNYTKKVIAQNVVDGVNAIIKKYKARKFLFMSVPPIEKWPYVPEAEKAKVDRLVRDYNALVKSELKKKVRHADLKFFDLHAWISDQLAHPEKLGLSTTNGPCDWGLGNTTDICDDPENHFFFDSFHPEAKVHKALGGASVAKLKHLYNIK